MRLKVDIGTYHTTVSVDCYGYEGCIPSSLGASELVFFTQLARLGTLFLPKLR